MQTHVVTAKALWITGVVTTVVTAILISVVNTSIHDLKSAMLTNARQDAEINHNRLGLNHLELRLRELMELSTGTNNAVIRVEEKLNSFEPQNQSK